MRGNNEAKVLRGEVEPDWAAAVRDTIASFPLVVSRGESMAVHGGIHPDRAPADHEPDELLEMRAVPPGQGYDGPFWFERYAGPPRVFFGHTVLGSPFVSRWAVGLDTGCVDGGQLTAFDCGADRSVAVDAERIYQERPDEKIVAVSS